MQKSPRDSTNLFVYGTLIFPEIISSIIHNTYSSERAILKNWQRFLVQNELYPAIIPGDGMVNGVLLFKINPADITILDDFEGEYYFRKVVEVESAGEIVLAETYVLHEDFRHVLSDQPWSEELFFKHHLEAFTREYRGWKNN